MKINKNIIKKLKHFSKYRVAYNSVFGASRGSFEHSVIDFYRLFNNIKLFEIFSSDLVALFGEYSTENKIKYETEQEYIYYFKRFLTVFISKVSIPEQQLQKLLSAIPFSELEKRLRDSYRKDIFTLKDTLRDWVKYVIDDTFDKSVWYD